MAGQSKPKYLQAEYNAWRAMVARCERPHHPAFKNYGGRGIRVCARWRKSYENFLADMGPRPSPRHSLDRKNNDRGYSPSNCRWAIDGTQRRNKRTNRMVTIGRRKMPLVDACRLRGLDPQIVYQRLCNGWAVADALADPKWPAGDRRGAFKRR